MYHGYASIAKGLKNTIRFNVANGEQRAVSINGTSLKFRLFDQSTNVQVLEKTLNVLDDTVTKDISTAQSSVGTVLTFANTTGIVAGQSVSGIGIARNTTVLSTTGTTVTLSVSTTSVASTGTTITFVTKTLKGGAELVLLGSDTQNLNSGRYVYTLFKDEGNEFVPLFINGAKGLRGNVDVVEGFDPVVIPSVAQTFQLKQNNIYDTGYFASDRSGASLDNIHHYSIHYNQFSGVMNLWASLDNAPPANISSGVNILRINALELKVQGFRPNDTQIQTVYVGNTKQVIQLQTGDKIRFTLTSAVDLTVTDYPTFAFKLGASTKYANIVRSNNDAPLIAKQIKFEYIIQSGDSTLSAIETFTNSIVENSGTVADARLGVTPTITISPVVIPVRTDVDEINTTVAGKIAPEGGSVNDDATTLNMPAGLFNYYGFEYIPVSGSIDKVLYRS